MEQICYYCKHCSIAGICLGAPDWQCEKHDKRVESSDTCRDFEPTPENGNNDQND